MDQENNKNNEFIDVESKDEGVNSQDNQVEKFDNENSDNISADEKTVEEDQSFSKKENVDNDMQDFDVVEEKKEKIRTDSYFDGSLIELIGYHLLSGIITTFTLGIGRPWAECLIMGYKINHTVLNGKRLRFEGKGSSYFVQKFKWIFFTIITLGIYSFWIPINKVKWQVKNTYFEDEEYIIDNSYFDGRLIQLIGINLLSWLLIVISFGVLYPFVHCMKIRWITKHTIINRKKLLFNGSAINLFLHYLLWVFLTLITFGIYGLWLGINYMKWQTKNTHIKLKDEKEDVKNSNDVIISLIIVCVVFIVGAFIIGKLLANFRPVVNTDAEANIRNTIINAKNEFSSKQYTDDEVDKWKSSNNAIPINSIKKLDLDTLNTFDKNGGFGVFTYNSSYDRYDESTNITSRQVELVLKYKNMVCLATMNTKPTEYTDDHVECKTFGEYVNLSKSFFRVRPFSGGKDVSTVDRDFYHESVDVYNNYD